MESSIVSIFGSNLSADEIEFIGTGFFVNYEDLTFLVTAGHNIDQSYTTLYYKCDGSLISFKKYSSELDWNYEECETIREESGKWLADLEDYAILKLPGQLKGLELSTELPNAGDVFDFYAFFDPKETNTPACEMIKGRYKNQRDFILRTLDCTFERRNYRIQTRRQVELSQAIPGNSGGPALFENSNKVFGMLTNGKNNNALILISSFLIQKIDLFLEST